MRTVKDLKKGEFGTIERFLDETISCRLLRLGILPNAQITMVRKAPFGGAYYLKLNGLNIAVRDSEANSILLKED